MEKNSYIECVLCMLNRGIRRRRNIGFYIVQKKWNILTKESLFCLLFTILELKK